MLFPPTESLDVGQLDGFGLAHFVRGPILEGILGMRLHRVLNDSGGRTWFGKTLRCKQVHTHQQAKKERAHQGQWNTLLLSCHNASLFQKRCQDRTRVQTIRNLVFLPALFRIAFPL
jgi:hypothetical protein